MIRSPCLRFAVLLIALIAVPLPALAGSDSGERPAQDEVNVVLRLWQAFLVLLPGRAEEGTRSAAAASQAEEPGGPQPTRGVTIDPNG